MDTLFAGQLTEAVQVAAGHSIRVLFPSPQVAAGVRWIEGENSNDFGVEGNCDGWAAMEGESLPAVMPCEARVALAVGTANVRLSRDLDNEPDQTINPANGFVVLNDTAEPSNLVALVVTALTDCTVAVGSALEIVG